MGDVLELLLSLLLLRLRVLQLHRRRRRHLLRVLPLLPWLRVTSLPRGPVRPPLLPILDRRLSVSRHLPGQHAQHRMRGVGDIQVSAGPCDH
jgi:hypothetical protein